MTLEMLLFHAAGISLIIGSGFIVVGVIGLLRFNDPMTRLHAPTKVGTIGIGMLLLASMLVALGRGDPSFHELLIMAFLFVTAPISAHFIAKVSMHRRDCQTPPPPPRDKTWATLATTPIEEQKGPV